jgi:hypothetical protein
VDRTWTECFAQLVGTILSLWDAAELDAAGSEGEVLPKFINLTDASIKMVKSRNPLDVNNSHHFADRGSSNKIKRRSTTTKRSQHINGREEQISAPLQLSSFSGPMDGWHSFGHV